MPQITDGQPLHKPPGGIRDPGRQPKQGRREQVGGESAGHF